MTHILSNINWVTTEFKRQSLWSDSCVHPHGRRDMRLYPPSMVSQSCGGTESPAPQTALEWAPRGSSMDSLCVISGSSMNSLCVIPGSNMDSLCVIPVSIGTSGGVFSSPCLDPLYSCLSPCVH